MYVQCRICAVWPPNLAAGRRIRPCTCVYSIRPCAVPIICLAPSPVVSPTLLVSLSPASFQSSKPGFCFVSFSPFLPLLFDFLSVIELCSSWSTLIFLHPNHNSDKTTPKTSPSSCRSTPPQHNNHIPKSTTTTQQVLIQNTTETGFLARSDFFFFISRDAQAFFAEIPSLSTAAASLFLSISRFINLK